MRPVTTALLVNMRSEAVCVWIHTHNLIDQDGPENSWPWHACSEEEIQKKQRSGNEPIDVANVEDLAEGTSNLGVATKELDFNGGEAKVGAHREVGDTGDEDYTSGDVVEDALRS